MRRHGEGIVCFVAAALFVALPCGPSTRALAHDEPEVRFVQIPGFKAPDHPQRLTLDSRAVATGNENPAHPGRTSRAGRRASALVPFLESIE